MKTLIYQLFLRQYTNTNANNTPNGTIEQNGCGKFNDINNAALQQLADLGITHVWYTGVLRHASTTHYPYQTLPSNANVVKGKAGSPYAICDYYDVCPDLAQDLDHRLDEWKELVDRTHKHGLKVIMDFVPNHVARQYHSDVRTDIKNLGDGDDPSVPFALTNNFYYLPGTSFQSPVTNLDAPYIEQPAKASGNDSFTPKPTLYDWYETVKLNYGKDFAEGVAHFDPKPDTWRKMREILLFWVATGVDGFRVDMAEMVPVEFWTWVIAQVVARHPHIKFIAETYDTKQYQSYLAAGFNLLYDKVNFYDLTREVVCRRSPASTLTEIWRRTAPVRPKMLYFLENHDEQRFASNDFCADPWRAKPAYLLTTTMGRGAAMMYNGQEWGEKGMDAEGFSGHDGRTSIFDYWAPDTLRRNAQDLAFDGRAMTNDEKALRDWYAKINHIATKYEAFDFGEFYDLMWINQHIWVDATRVYAYLRFYGQQRFLIVLNFAEKSRRQNLIIPDDAWKLMGSSWNECIQPSDLLGNALYIGRDSIDNIKQRGLQVEVPPFDGLLLRF